MIKKVVFSIIILLLSTSSGAYAHPPTSVDLSYDTSKNAIIVVMKHQSKEKLHHYIRKIVTTKNDEEPMTQYFQKQVDRLNVTKEVPVSVEAGDEIVLKIYSKEGGVRTATLSITEETLNPPKTP